MTGRELSDDLGSPGNTADGQTLLLPRYGVRHASEHRGTGKKDIFIDLFSRQSVKLYTLRPHYLNITHKGRKGCYS